MVSPIDRYLARVPRGAQGKLRAVVRVIRQAVPDATEVISYRMPAFKYRGRILVYVAAFREHIGMYPPVPPALRRAASRFAGPKGNLRFPLDHPMPLALIRRIVTFKIKAMREKG